MQLCSLNPLYRSKFKVIIVLLCITASFFISQSLLAEPSTSLLSDQDSIEKVERVIDIDQRNNDQLIQQRLYKILQRSGKFTNISIEVREGLVEINATARSNQYVSWASDVAKNINGVIGVIDNVEAQPIDFLSIDPFKQELVSLWSASIKVMPLLIIGAFIFILFFMVSKPLSRWLIKPISFISDSRLVQIVIRRFIALFIILIGLYFFLRIAGLTQIAVAIISGTGVVGLVLGFAFKDIAENFISSLLISAQRPFKLNDIIQIQGHTGVVQKVTARGTTLVDLDGNHIQIPNSTIYKNIIHNFTANPRMRGSFVLGIGYDVDIDMAQKLGLQLMLDHPAILGEPEPQVLVDSLGSSTINLIFYFWINSQEFALIKVSSLCMKLMVQKFTEHSISMPDDAREVIFPEGIQLESSIAADNQSTLKPSHQSSYQPNQTKDSVTRVSNSAIDDLKSDHDAIKKQAQNAPTPEAGSNII